MVVVIVVGPIRRAAVTAILGLEGEPSPLPSLSTLRASTPLRCGEACSSSSSILGSDRIYLGSVTVCI